jgi:hypothetical protein
MRKIILAFLIVALSFATAAPAFAAKFDVRVHNNTEENVKVKLKGDKTYNFTVAPGKIAKMVDEDTYNYSYTSCSGTVEKSGSITVNKSGIWIIIEPCPLPKVESKFVINSNIGEDVTLSMIGPENYEFTIGLGKNRFLDIIAGTYTYSHEFCDVVVSGTIKVTKNGKSSLRLYACEQVEILSFGLPNPRNLRIGSHFAFPVTVTLIGPKQYYLTVNPGFTRIDVIKGTYSYFFTAYGKIYSGEIVVTGGGYHNTVILSPLDPIP